MHKAKKNLYTFIMEYKKKVYSYQVSDVSMEQAKIQWANNLNFTDIKAPEDSKKEFLEDYMREDHAIVLLDGLQQAFCSSCLINDIGATINIINTKHELKKRKNKISYNELYTVVFNFKGGIYVYQVVAANASEAKNNWLNVLDFNLDKALQSNKKECIHKVKKIKVSEVTGMQFVWFFEISLEKNIGIIHIVNTVAV
jgi:hypothetical protein